MPQEHPAARRGSVGSPAGVGLILTAVVTYFGVLATQDQLQQTRDANKERAAQQASRVTNWTEQDKSGTLREIVANRSYDPALGAWVRVPIRTNAGEYASSSFRIGQIPPCTSVTVKTATPAGREVQGEVIVFFTDSSGAYWKRSSTGSLSPVASAEPFVDPGAPASELWKTSRLEDCGTN